MTIPEETRPPGQTTIAPDVLIDIARLSALGVDGVSRLSGGQSVGRLFQGGHQSGGIRVDVVDGVVNVDLYVILFPDHNLRQVSREIQNQVTRAVREMVGMDVGRINIRIEDIDYGAEEP